MSKIKNEIAERLMSGVDQVMTSDKYKSPKTRRFDICNRYNLAIADVLQNFELTDVGRAQVRGAKGLITKTIVDSLDDTELNVYINICVKRILNTMFS